MVVQRRAEKNAAAAPLVVADLEDHACGLGDEDPADQQQEEFLPGDDRQQSQEPAQGKRAGVAHENLRRMTIEPEEPQHAADHGAGQDGHLAGAGNSREIEVMGQSGVSGGVDHQSHGPGGEDQAPAGQPVQSVGQVHRVGCAHDDDRRQWYEAQAERKRRSQQG